MQLRKSQLPFALTIAIFGNALAGEPISIEALSRTPDIQSVSMSTDGKNLVALIVAPGSTEDTALATWDLSNLDKGPAVTPSGDRMKFIGASAMKANRVLVRGQQEWSGDISSCGGEGRSGSLTRTFITKTYLTDTAHKKFDEAFASKVRKIGISEQTERCFDVLGSSSLVNGLPLDPDNIIINRVDPATYAGNFYLYNLRTDDAKLLSDVKDGTSPVLFNPRNGDVLVRSRLEPVGPGEYEIRLLLRNPDTGAFEVHDKLTNKLSSRHTFEIDGFDEKTGKYYVLTDKSSDNVQAWLYDPKTREFDPEPLVAHPQYDIGGLIYGTRPSNFGRVLGFTVNSPRSEVTWVDPAFQSIQASLEKAFPGQSVSLGSYNDDLSRLLFTTSGAQNPPTYHLLLDKKQVKTLGSSRPWVDAKQIGEQRWITYTARDGMQIPAILDLPAGWKPGDGPLPAVVHPHGGPWSREYLGWDASGWVPFLTSRGYAVLRPQYRGSAGLGRKLWLAGDAEWGLKMQDDKDDGAAWLVQQGIAAKDRIAIFGYSYGGFAASAAVVRPNGPYQCAIAGAPVTDLTKLGMRWSDSRLQRILQGSTVKGMDPMENTDKASIPLLTFVGDRDVRTPAFHAEGFYKAVKDKVSAKFQLIPDHPHSMPWYPHNAKTIMTLLGDYLKNDCGPGGL